MSTTRFAVSDGAPAGAPRSAYPHIPAVPADGRVLPPEGHVLEADLTKSRLSMLLRVEGERGYSERTAVWLRHLSYVVAVIFCSFLTQAMTNDVPYSHNAGVLMLFACSFMVLVAAVGTFAFPNNRREVVTQLRHMLFGYVLWPGTGIAALMWAMLGHVAVTGSMFSGLLVDALPIFFVMAVFIPPAVFVRYVFGLRTLYRTRQDDLELMSIYTRQTGGLQR
jgi:hypothetical protein